MNAGEFQSVMTTKAGARVIGKQPSPTLPKQKGTEINLRDRLNSALSTEKHLAVGYTTSMNEAIDPGLYNLLGEARDEVQHYQRKFFEALFNLGEYGADLAMEPQVTDAVDVFTTYKGQLPYGSGPETLH